MRAYIERWLKQSGQITITSEFLDKAFPEPRRPTVEEMETTILSAVASPLVEDRSKIAHVFQSSRKEQIEDFCKRNNCIFSYDYSTTNTIIFRDVDRID